MKSLIKLSVLTALLALTSCAHHGSCSMHGKEGCKMDAKACCKEGAQCPMKAEEAKTEVKK